MGLFGKYNCVKRCYETTICPGPTGHKDPPDYMISRVSVNTDILSFNNPARHFVRLCVIYMLVCESVSLGVCDST